MPRGKMLCPSMMCADYGHIADEVDALVAAEVDMLHLDVMDGAYVPNFGLDIDMVKYICGRSTVPCDAHLMVEDPARYIDAFARAGVKIIYIHPESDVHIARTLQMIRDAGCEAGLALNPATSLTSFEPALNLVDFLMIMTVNPGFAGQAYLPFIGEKVRDAVAAKERYDYRVMIDGACSPQVIRELSAIGADGFVLGTSALFGKGRPYREIIDELRCS